MVDGAGAPPPSAAVRSPRTRRRRLLAVVIPAVVVLVAAAIVAGGLWHRDATRDHIERAAPGDCVADAYPRMPPYRLVPCADPAAEYRVLAMLDRDDAGRSCGDVAGASLAISVQDRRICVGRPTVDPATAMNVAKEGDCVYQERPRLTGADPLRLDCGDSRANYRVVKRRTDVGSLTVKFGDACAGVPGAVDLYAWTWRSSDPRFAGLGSTIVLCLGHKNPPTPPPPTLPPDHPDAPGSNCRFLTPAEVSAAVSAAAGRTYTVRKRRKSSLDFCEYQFGAGKSVVQIAMTAAQIEYRPGTGDVTLTVDGLRAIWGPGSGNRVLSVWAPAGKFTVVVWLDGVGDNLSRKIAIELFRRARPRLR